MASYYDSNKATVANSKGFALGDGEQHFPSEGLYLGELTGGSIELPALYDISTGKGLCFLYNSELGQRQANACIERLVWRIALCVPSHLCDIVMYNGGDPTDAFLAHSRMDKYLMGDRKETIYFDGNADALTALLNETYASIIERMATIRSAGKRDLVELNESLGIEARLKYQFFILADFPGYLKMEAANRLAQIMEVGGKAGVYVLMSFDMNADFVDANTTENFNPSRLLTNMQLLVPNGGGFSFRNSGHDEIFNRFNFVPDCVPMSPEENEYCLRQTNLYVETVKEKVKPKILKQDFDRIEEDTYEPAISEISVTVGLDVRDKHPVTFRFNSGDYIHGFILGQSGSGKSVLLNNIITSAILKYSPQDLMLYLMDFKGVEFNRYRGLKHTKAVLVDNSDSQMTLEVLRELKEENKRRVELWQKEGVNTIDGYNKKYPNNRLPQVLFVADECQVMFKESTQGTERLISREISEILNTIATQGRSQGIHMLLATQQLGEINISDEILTNLTECFLLMSAPSDSDRLVPDSSDLTSKQMTGLACYYHKRELQSQVQTFYASNEELEAAISSAQKKAASLPGNGEHYFCGSSFYYLEQDKDAISQNDYNIPIAIAGRNIGINSGATTLPIHNDFMENILVFGANKQEQATGVAMNILASLMMSYQQQGIYCQFIVIDCQVMQKCRYKSILDAWNSKGLCRLVSRQESGTVLHDLVDDISNNIAQPTILAIIGQERFIEMRRKLPLDAQSSVGFNLGDMGDFTFDSFDPIADIEVDENAVIPELTEEEKQQILEELDGTITETSQSNEEPEEKSLADRMTFPKALSYILDEGPLQGVHTLLLVDKPGNILFEGDYDVNDADKFRHKIILKSENKFLSPLRFSQDIDVEQLSDNEKHLRAYYYPDGDDPVLFTPFQMPDKDII